MAKIYRIEILPTAQAELEEITHIHLALSGPSSASGIADKICGAMERLKYYPLSGQPARDEQLRALGYRYVLADKYMLFYRILGDAVFIYHIARGAADYPKLSKSARLE